MRRTLVAVAAGILATAALGQAQFGPVFGGVAEHRADVSARRARAMDALGPESMLVLWSAPERVYSTDINYEYKQDTYLSYLTGMDQEETILVLVPGATTRREFIFAREADPRRDHWNGHTYTPAEVTELTGIKEVHPLSAFQPFMQAVLAGQAYPASAPGGDFAPLADAIGKKTAKLAVLLERQAPNTPAAPGSRQEFTAGLAARFPGVTPSDARPILNRLRMIKTPYEQKLMRRSVEISAEAHVEGMKAARPGRFEYEVEAAIEYHYMKNGAMSWGYPSIVGSGPNATVLHYGKSHRQMQDGDLLLVDAAAAYQNYTGDITRTYPINGRFSPEQRAIYEIVLAAQEAGIAAAKIGATGSQINGACRQVIVDGLLKLGLITEASQVGTWFTHGTVHGLGLDVHDVGNYGSTPLAAGMSFVIEPGIYIREAALETLPASPAAAAAFKAFAAKVRPMVLKYKDLGVRIEDSFLLTETGLVQLSAKAPRRIAEIEKLVGTGR